MIVSVNGGLTPLWQGGRVTMGLLALITGAIFFGSVAQRIAGIGFALLVAPILAILLGPHEGIMMINICAVVSCGLIVPRVWREIDWNLLLWLSVPAVAGTVVGSWLAVQVPPAVLSTVVGAVVMAGLAVAVVLGRAQVTVSGQLPKALAGLGSGLTNALAGVGGPTVSAYAILSRWPPRPFAATLQPFFLQLCLITVGVKLAVDPGSVPHWRGGCGRSLRWRSSWASSPANGSAGGCGTNTPGPRWWCWPFWERPARWPKDWWICWPECGAFSVYLGPLTRGWLYFLKQVWSVARHPA